MLYLFNIWLLIGKVYGLYHVCGEQFLLSGYYFNNNALLISFRLKGQVDDRRCVFCQVQEDTLKHLFWTCCVA